MRLNTHEWGDAGAPLVVCLHGVMGHGMRFRKLAEERLVPAGFRALSVDLRGHGRSGYEPPWDLETHAGDLVETLDAHGDGTASWIGHSFGGRLVMEVAARVPERMHRAVLLDPAIQLDPSTALESAEESRVDVSFDSPEEAIRARLDSGTLFGTPPGILEEEMREHLVQGDDGRLRYRFLRSAAVTAWSEMATEPPALPPVPTLVVTGEKSWLPVMVAPAKLLGVVTVPAGHQVLWDAFDQVADAVEAFLTR